MRNDISSAKKFRDEYLRKIGHGMDDNTVISLLIEYASNIMVESTASNVDAEALQSSNQALKERISTLEKLVKEFSEENEQLKQKIVSLEKVFSEQTADVVTDETDQTKIKTAKKK